MDLLTYLLTLQWEGNRTFGAVLAMLQIQWHEPTDGLKAYQKHTDE